MYVCLYNAFFPCSSPSSISKNTYVCLYVTYPIQISVKLHVCLYAILPSQFLPPPNAPNHHSPSPTHSLSQCPQSHLHHILHTCVLPPPPPHTHTPSPTPNTPSDPCELSSCGVNEQLPYTRSELCLPPLKIHTITKHHITH